MYNKFFLQKKWERQFNLCCQITGHQNMHRGNLPHTGFQAEQNNKNNILTHSFGSQFAYMDKKKENIFLQDNFYPKWISIVRETGREKE